MTMLDIAPQFDEERLRSLLAPLERGERTSTTFTTIHRHRDGTDLTVEITIQARRDDTGRPRAYIKIVRDIGERLETDAHQRHVEQDLRLVKDRERIARDLHDRTIQRLFAAGLTLQGAQQRSTQEDVSSRLNAVVEELDDTIQELRSVIFGFESHDEDSGLRNDILRIASDAGHLLGLEPRVRFTGPVDTISVAIGAALLATLREALSNVARHAQASSVEVTVECDDNVVLRVLDNGRGLDDDAVAGQGIRNAAARAALLGGHSQLGPRPGGGTVLEWLVPNTH
jgi:signal transduction histidine kinase